MKANQVSRKKAVKRRVFFVLLVAGIFLSTPGFSEEKVSFVRSLSSGMESPVDTAVSSTGDVYVLDEALSTVSIFSKDGKLKLSFGERGSLLGQLYKPRSLALTLEGDIVVADTGNSRVEVFKPNGEFSYELGNSGSEPGQFKLPTDVAVDMMGYIYVIDGKAKKVAKFSPHGAFLSEQNFEEQPTDIVFDVAQNMYLLFRESGIVKKYPAEGKDITTITSVSDEGYNPLLNADSLDVDARGDIYIIEALSNNIIKVDQEGNVLFSFGSQGVGRGQFDKPKNITADSQRNIFVADSENKRVQMLEVMGQDKPKLKHAEYASPVLDYESSIYTGDKIIDVEFIKDRGLYSLSDYKGKILLKGSEGALTAKSDENYADLNNPKAIYVYKNGKMLVADTGNNRIQFLNEDGSSDYFFGKKGKATSEFNSPEGIAVSKEGYIFVSDTKNNRIQEFNEDGIYLNSFGSLTEFTDDYGADIGTLSMPKDLEFDSQDHLYVLDYKNKRIQVFDKDGKVVKVIGNTLDGLNFVEPVDFTLDEYDYLYVADKGSHTIHIIDPSGRQVMEFGSDGKGPSYFPSLTSIESYNGKIYVSDYMSEYVKVFDFDPSADKKMERVFIAKVIPQVHAQGTTEEIRKQMTENMAIKKLRGELASSFNMDEENIGNIMKVESQEMLDNGQFTITVSIPKIFEQRQQIDKLSKK